MDMDTLISLVSRWVHIGSAIVLLGGSVFMRFVLMPAAEQLPESEHQALRERVLGRWKWIVMLGVLLLLISGLYNYVVVGLPQHRGDKLYHPVMGTKILLALCVFFLAAALTGRSAALEPIRRNAKRWLSVLILLALTVVALAGYLKVVRKPTLERPAASGLHDASGAADRMAAN